MKTNWKDQNGMPLAEGDQVLLCDPGMDSSGIVTFVPDFGRYMIRVTHRLIHGGSSRWQRVDDKAVCWRALDDRRRMPFSRRLKGVFMVQRADRPRLDWDFWAARDGGYAPLPMM